MQDPIADMLTRIRNGQSAQKQTVELDSSKMKVSIAEVLKQEGFISDYQTIRDGNKVSLLIKLKYYENEPVIKLIKRVSRTSLRVYNSKKELDQRVSDFGIRIVSTPLGVMSDRLARQSGVGGEVICVVA